MRLIAFYLPQFYPVRENDDWWGKGFTEWNNVARARQLFPHHDQPHLPADLGFYDLRLPEARRAQADLAAEYGVHGFCYYHYWFHGRRLLERPFEAVLGLGQPELPFCLCWANENWTRAWDGKSGEILIRQEYSEADDLTHIRWLLRAFCDPRYIRVAGKPLFLIYRASRLPDPARTLAMWRAEAARAGLPGLFLCRVEAAAAERGDPALLGFDAAVEFQPDWTNLGAPLRSGRFWRLARRLKLADPVYGQHRIFDYGRTFERMLQKPAPPYLRLPCVTPGWDNSPRRRNNALILVGATPAGYQSWLTAVLARFSPANPEENLVFVNAWNEWGEGCHLEPSQRWGRAYLAATRAALQADRERHA